MLQKSLNLCKHGNMLLSLTLKENTISNIFTIIHTVEIPTQKGEHSWICTELSLKWKEGTVVIHGKSIKIYNWETLIIIDQVEHK